MPTTPRTRPGTMRLADALQYRLPLAGVVSILHRASGAMILTADHGNAELMVDPVTGQPHTAHTTNPVPVALIGGPPGAALQNGRLADLAPTLLDLMDVPLPPEMTGHSLIVRPPA